MKLSLNKLNVALAVSTITLMACAGDPGQPSSSSSGNAIAVVNGVSIPEKFADVIIAEQRARGAPDDQNMKDNIRKDLIRRELLVQAATTVGIDKRADTLAKQNLARQNVLIGDYVQDWIKNNPPTDDEIKQEYDSIKEKLGAQKEYHARHVLVKTEAEAKSLIAQLKKGAKFATLAKKSLDPGSKDNGGDLGWANPAMFVPPFSEAMMKLDKGQYTTEPVKTDFGYHVILLEEMREVQSPPLEEVKSELQQRLQQKKWQAYVDQLEKDAKVSEVTEAAK